MDLETVIVRPATLREYRVVSRMLELYLHDLSEADGEDVDECGRFRYTWLPDFWRKADHAAFVILAGDKYAGFALVDNDVVIPDRERSIEEFFVLRKYRRQGIGKQAATAIFRASPGRWEVGQRMTNDQGRAFWRNVIGSLTDGGFSEVEVGHGITLQLFDNTV